jgi:hypothetical protein
MITESDPYRYARDPIGSLADETVRSIRWHLDNGLLTQALTILYAALDALSWLNVATNTMNTTRAHFIDWVDAYFLPGSGLPCSADDIYSARCGILHSRLAGSVRAAAERGARDINYRTGPDEVHSTTRWRSSAEGSLIEVGPNDLLQAFINAVDRFAAEVNGDDERRRSVQGRAIMWLRPYRPGVCLHPPD